MCDYKKIYVRDPIESLHVSYGYMCILVLGKYLTCMHAFSYTMILGMGTKTGTYVGASNGDQRYVVILLGLPKTTDWLIPTCICPGW